MNSINARGTYLCSRVCLPHLKQGSNPHILNISPPMNMNPKWFKGHVAYTMAKYGMSMYVLGMAEEFKSEGVAVNALWPKTAIATAAMEMLAGDNYLNICRKMDIMSDAAYSVLTSDSRSITGQFLIDEDVLRKTGVTDFDHYNCVPGSDPMPDFFLDVEDTSSSSDKAATSSTGIEAVFSDINTLLNEELVQKTNGVFQFDLTGDSSGTWFLDLKNGAGSSGKGAPDSANVVMTLDATDFVKMFTGELKPAQAFMAGKLKIKGDMMLAMKLEKLMKVKSKL